MTNDQFNALAKLVRSRGGVAEQAARLVLVEDCSNKEAEERTGISPSRVSDVVRLYRQAYEMAKRAAGV